MDNDSSEPKLSGGTAAEVVWIEQKGNGIRIEGEDGDYFGDGGC